MSKYHFKHIISENELEASIRSFHLRFTLWEGPNLELPVSVFRTAADPDEVFWLKHLNAPLNMDRFERREREKTEGKPPPLSLMIKETDPKRNVTNHNSEPGIIRRMTNSQ